MQTFLPYSSYQLSAQCLDDKRLGKQRVECKQILLALGICIGEHAGNDLSSWRNHPATVMWKHHESQLLQYAIAVCAEWRARGFKDILLPQFVEAFTSTTAGSVPPWLGDNKLHESHQSNLLRKNQSFYSQFGWSVAADLPYYWPSHHIRVVNSSFSMNEVSYAF